MKHLLLMCALIFPLAAFGQMIGRSSFWVPQATAVAVTDTLKYIASAEITKNSSTASYRSWPFTMQNVTNALAFVILNQNNTLFDSVKWGTAGQKFTQLDTVTSPRGYCSIWYLKSPTAETDSIYMWTKAGAFKRWVGGVVQFRGVASSDYLGSVVKGADSIDVTSSAGNIIIDFGNADNSGTTFGAGQTEWLDEINDSDAQGVSSSYKTSIATSTPMKSDHGTDGGRHGGVEIRRKDY